jgi:hypothetical protein
VRVAPVTAVLTRGRDGVAALDRWLFVPGPVGRVRTMRLLLAVVIAGRVGLGPYRGLAGQPAALFHPVWFLTWLPHMPSAGVIVGLQVVGVVAALAVVLRWQERWAFLVAWASLLVLAGLRASRGKVMHNDVPVLLVGVVLLLAPVGWRALDRRRSAAGGWPGQAALLVVGGAYFLTGFQKLVASGPAWVLSDNLRNVMYRAAAAGHGAAPSLALAIADRPLLAHLVALATIAVELGAVTIWIWPRVRPWYLLATTTLHVGVYLTHGLDYSAWIGTAAIVLVDWSAVLLALSGRRRRGPAAERRPGTRSVPAAR